jgi:hypothetical protein
MSQLYVFTSVRNCKLTQKSPTLYALGVSKAYADTTGRRVVFMLWVYLRPMPIPLAGVSSRPVVMIHVPLELGMSSSCAGAFPYGPTRPGWLTCHVVTSHGCHPRPGARPINY